MQKDIIPNLPQMLTTLEDFRPKCPQLTNIIDIINIYTINLLK